MEFHGDTNMVVVEPRLSSMTYGWCIKNTSAVAADVDLKQWDCQVVQAQVDPTTENVIDPSTTDTTSKNSAF